MKLSKKYLLAVPFFVLMVIFFVVPMAWIIVSGLQNENGASITEKYQPLVGGYSFFQSFWTSLWTATVTVLVALLVAFPFCYFLSQSKNKVFRSFVIALATAPIWSSFLIKLIGLKTLLDLVLGLALNRVGDNNLTFGSGYTLIGMIYLFTPFMFLPLYNNFCILPKNLILASQDLGYNWITSFIKVVIPFSKTAILSGIALTFFPSLTSVAIAQFLDNSNQNNTLGNYVFTLGNNGYDSAIERGRASGAIIIAALITFAFYFVVIFAPRIVRLIQTKCLKYRRVNV
ncbi:ABC transporter permease [Mycoplasmoides pneumoniae]|uniref:Spermidine/putrescine transport system permease protein PotB homolog n=2 Tax=Mycoplasmoides pneumoniae TaxID=2104 RepID=POTB_MYCPN|nr:ABC transporter permease [Mycoplasmoides pneumoniae]P75058.1 RecName: Full=Spermidine/putrescine transport system permease protein PotB homolog [Mycoplasmoides pneumoniae M129]AAB95746.1 spermidine/putrescine transport system permease [Mycoplasmoides pneumoniae M129]AGC03996.1 spermidine/putrescine ABC transporter permease [Mycoplasmoides pneumoniae M129-B7]ALA29934.1 spermidine/putrescine ABC transporter permease [Mycoplasmoides pneumoniae PI 1428]ALA32049.1 spermidine/putrescine ABC trans